MSKQKIAKTQKSSKNFKKKISVETLKTKVIFKMDNVTIQFTQVEARWIGKELTKAVSAQDTHKGSEKNHAGNTTLGKQRYKNEYALHSGVLV